MMRPREHVPSVIIIDEPAKVIFCKRKEKGITIFLMIIILDGRFNPIRQLELDSTGILVDFKENDQIFKIT
ncbi:MAG TPA: hypothetical protein VKM55_18000 [Candidatus Lokiarchaeia archaeon]|nr:hypothetical protein [Candidatus Lokiarchaeia archaeon]